MEDQVPSSVEPKKPFFKGSRLGKRRNAAGGCSQERRSDADIHVDEGQSCQEDPL